LFLAPSELAVEDRGLDAGLAQSLDDRVLGGAELGEDDRLLAMERLDAAQQRANLALLDAHLTGPSRQPTQPPSIETVGALAQLLERRSRRGPGGPHLLLQHHQ